MNIPTNNYTPRLTPMQRLQHLKYAKLEDMLNKAVK